MRESTRRLATLALLVAAAAASAGTKAVRIEPAAFDRDFKTIEARSLLVRSPDGDRQGSRLRGASLAACASIIGWPGDNLAELDSDEFGCFAIARFRLADGVQAYLLRVPGLYESNDKVLAVFRGPALLATLRVAGGFGDAGESQDRRSLIDDFDGDGGLAVLTHDATLHDKAVLPDEPDRHEYALHRWSNDRFVARTLRSDDPLVRKWRRRLSGPG